MAGGDTEITLSMIARRNLDPSLHKDTTEELGQSLQLLNTVRLDREGITTLRNLEAVKEIHSLYLQQNFIRKIENLDALKNLRFLSLSGNLIEDVQNLHCLQNLQFLDLSHNKIQNLCAGELPSNLLILDLTGNSCTQRNGYRQQVLEYLPLLQELDGGSVLDRESPEPASELEKEEEDEDSCDSDDLLSSSSAISGYFSAICQDLLERSYERREKAEREHRERLEELSDAPLKHSLQRDAQSSSMYVEDSCSTFSQKDTKSFASSKTKSSAVKTPQKLQATPPHTPNGAGVEKATLGPRSASIGKLPSSASCSTKQRPPADFSSSTTRSPTKLPQTSTPSPKRQPAAASALKSAPSPNKLRTSSSPSASAQIKRQTSSSGKIQPPTSNTLQLAGKPSITLQKTRLGEKFTNKK
ncbi:leucine-rich repeat-containing protein 46 [Discoglossus pictus]